MSKNQLLLLSIQGVHADKIFEGTKKYELRKKIPLGDFERVYLYETGGVGIIGYFEPGAILRTNTKTLWKRVGTTATSKERFDKYFHNTAQGCAIRVKKAVRFSTPIFPLMIKNRVPSFVVPMSYLVVKCGSGLFELLEGRRLEELRPKTVNLQSIKRKEHTKYAELITPLIAAKYDEITEKFASNILSINNKGYDVNGILTQTKRVLSIISGKKLIGFTTATFKLGGALKTGPTVLFPKYRNKGFGLALRRALISYAIKHRVRRLYCTCPDNESKLMLHFIRAGYSIEAHLLSHYSSSNGELVFGLLLKSGVERQKQKMIRGSQPGSFVEVGQCSHGLLSKFLEEAFIANWTKISRRAAVQLVKKSGSTSALDYEDKPTDLIVFKGKRKFLSLGLLIHKRGGASKLLIYSKTTHQPTIRALLSRTIARAQSLGRRKLYCILQWNDLFWLEQLKLLGFQSEGILKEPYVSGTDQAILSKAIGE